MITLDDIHMTSGVNEQGEAFVTITATGTRPDGGKVLMLGQLDPEQVRAHAMAYLEVAEAAEQDAAVLRVLLHNLDIPQKQAEQMAALIITELRQSRKGRDDGTS